MCLVICSYLIHYLTTVSKPPLNNPLYPRFIIPHLHRWTFACFILHGYMVSFFRLCGAFLDSRYLCLIRTKFKVLSSNRLKHNSIAAAYRVKYSIIITIVPIKSHPLAKFFQTSFKVNLLLTALGVGWMSNPEVEEEALLYFIYNEINKKPCLIQNILLTCHLITLVH